MVDDAAGAGAHPAGHEDRMVMLLRPAEGPVPHLRLQQQQQHRRHRIIISPSTRACRGPCHLHPISPLPMQARLSDPDRLPSLLYFLQVVQSQLECVILGFGKQCSSESDSRHREQEGRSRRLLGHSRRSLVHMEGHSDDAIDVPVYDARYAVYDAREGHERERGHGEEACHGSVDNLYFV